MGLLVNGEWQDKWYDTKSNGGKFIRQDSAFRNWITADGSPGPSGIGGFKAEAGRYHLFVSNACPWAHRTMIFRKLKNLESFIGLTAVAPLMLKDGWTFDRPEPILGTLCLWQIYTAAKHDYTGRVTVPVLWDKQTKTIVSNESSEIIRMFNSAFNTLTGSVDDFYPQNLQTDIDKINAKIYDTINNGVYKAGFATSPEAYKDAVTALFESLNEIEEHLSENRYLAGNQLTEADWRLFTTLIRFDAVYVGHFKCNIRRIEDYPALSGYLRDLYQYPGIAETVNMIEIKHHYYGSHETINPSGIVPAGPQLDFGRPHDRAHLANAA